MAEGIELVNLKELDKLLSVLPVDLQGRIWRSANRKTGTILLKKLKANVPNPYNHLGAAFTIAADKYNTSGVLIGVRTPRKAVKNDDGSYQDTDRGYMIRWIEYGTSQRQTKEGNNRGVFKPKPFMRQTVDEAEPELLDYINKEYGTIINKALESRIKSTMKKIQKIKM